MWPRWLPSGNTLINTPGFIYFFYLICNFIIYFRSYSLMCQVSLSTSSLCLFSRPFHSSPVLFYLSLPCVFESLSSFFYMSVCLLCFAHSAPCVPACVPGASLVSTSFSSLNCPCVLPVFFAADFFLLTALSDVGLTANQSSPFGILPARPWVSAFGSTFSAAPWQILPWFFQSLAVLWNCRQQVPANLCSLIVAREFANLSVTPAGSLAW